MRCRKRALLVLALCLPLGLWLLFRASVSGLGLPPSLPTVRCTASANVSAWFSARYDAAAGPLLTGPAHELSPDVVHWWLVSGARGELGSLPGSFSLLAAGFTCPLPPSLPHGTQGGEGLRAAGADAARPCLCSPRPCRAPPASSRSGPYSRSSLPSSRPRMGVCGIRPTAGRVLWWETQGG